MSDLGPRFWMKVDLSGPCWEWTAGRLQGYGKFWLDGQMRMAHRLSYESLVGPISDGLTLDHLCRNRACVRPEHLEPVTLAENVLRGEGVPAQNARKDRCIRGHLFTPQNTITKRNGRACRVCANTDTREWKRRQKAKVSA